MSDSLSLDTDLAEAALHARVTQRCQRAYAHDLRNSLQAIYTGFDVLTRMLEGKGSAKLPSDKAGAIVRKSIVNHEQSLEQVRQHLTLQNDSPAGVRVDHLLDSLTSFLNNDASSREIRLAAQSEALTAWARPSKLRLVLLFLITEGIDALTEGGELVITAVGDGTSVVLELAVIAARQTWPASTEWRPVDDASDWAMQTVSRIVQRDGGAVETAGTGTMRRIRLRYGAATPLAATPER